MELRQQVEAEEEDEEENVSAQTGWTTVSTTYNGFRSLQKAFMCCSLFHTVSSMTLRQRIGN